MPKTKESTPHTKINDFSFAPQLQWVTCDVWGFFERKNHFKDWPDFRQTAKDCDEWIDETSLQAVDRVQEFNNLVKIWHQETMFMSSVIQMAMHPSYQRVIGMGQPALPLILTELSQNPSHWFWALESITGENPADNVTTFDEGVEAWLKWGRAKGYIR